MADRTIEYKVIIDTSTGKSSITDLNGNLVEAETLTKKLGETTKQTGSDGAKSFQEMTATIRDLTVAYAGIQGAVNSVLGIFKEYIDLAGIQAGAETRLSFALKQTGDSSKETLESYKTLASELQRITTVGDEVSLKLMGLASQYGVQTSKLGDVAKGAIGLSEAFGVDLESATKLLSGAMQGEYEMLNRMIPQMRTAKDDTERAAILNKVLANTFDYATERAKGFAGQQKQTQNNINDLKEEIGLFVRSVLKPAYVFINDLSLFMRDHLALSIGIMSGAISTAAIPAFIALGTQLKAIVAEVTLATGGFNLIIPALVAIATATAVYSSEVNKNTDKTIQNTNETEKNKKAREDLQKTTEDLTENTKKLNNLLDETNKKNNEDERITKARAARDEYFKLTDERIKLLDKELQAKKITGDQWAAEYNKIIEIEDVFNKQLSDAYDAVNAEKNAKSAEEAQKKLDEQKKLDDELFQERMAADNAETERLKTEQDKRIADNQAFLIKQQEETDRINDEMEMREIEGAWKVAEETKKAAKEKSDAEKKAQQDKAEYQKQGLKDSLNNLQALKTLGKDAANIAKGAAVASATIDTIESAGKSYKWGASWGGPVGGAIMAAIAVAAGAARVAQITATGTGFQSGGYTGDLPENQTAGTVHGREFVMNAETTRRIGIPTLSAIQAGVPVTTLPSAQFAGNATTSGLNGVTGSVQAMNMNMVNGTMPTPVIEINANTDLVNFEIKRREVSNEVDKTGRSFDNVS